MKTMNKKPKPRFKDEAAVLVSIDRARKFKFKREVELGDLSFTKQQIMEGDGVGLSSVKDKIRQTLNSIHYMDKRLHRLALKLAEIRTKPLPGLLPDESVER